MSSDFVNASLLQLQAAAQLPSGSISETATNAAHALIEAAAPRDELEGALAVQMACTPTPASRGKLCAGASYHLKRRRAQPQAMRDKVTEIPKARTTCALCLIIASPRST
jgi:hypothetical protein